MNRSTANTPTRERILNAAMEVFAARGYHGTVVDTITAASGTSKGAFYHYFPSKQAIFLTLMDELASDVEHGVELVIASEQGALAKVEAALQVVLETAAARRDLVRILLIEAVGLGPTLEGARLEIHRRFARLIQRHLDRATTDGDIPPQDTALAARAWIGALNEVITQWLMSGTSDLMSSLPALRTLLLRSIGAAGKS
ncbi:MAG: TetR/AcrR family transcriptional regulator [Bacillati bacterium ANGP1]|uniref:TetR/AcrR family transcriptional regulator n=1 Tax=Candidatus Segetimicrobium genomatis TaxID=2569760 RepID=A0A537LKD7_9BACT|nr:MAG: TetR/AcrR family transcriptional regulator [Terrabacteria group bacterium ANGP1]